MATEVSVSGFLTSRSSECMIGVKNALIISKILFLAPLITNNLPILYPFFLNYETRYIFYVNIYIIHNLLIFNYLY